MITPIVYLPGSIPLPSAHLTVKDLSSGDTRPLPGLPLGSSGSKTIDTVSSGWSFSWGGKMTFPSTGWPPPPQPANEHRQIARVSPASTRERQRIAATEEKEG